MVSIASYVLQSKYHNCLLYIGLTMWQKHVACVRIHTCDFASSGFCDVIFVDMQDGKAHMQGSMEHMHGVKACMHNYKKVMHGLSSKMHRYGRLCKDMHAWFNGVHAWCHHMHVGCRRIQACLMLNGAHASPFHGALTCMWDSMERMYDAWLTCVVQWSVCMVYATSNMRNMYWYHN